MTQDDDNSFGRAVERVRTALAAMGFGNAEPYIDRWAKSDDATLFGAWGPIERGYARLTETFRWVGSRFKSGALEHDPEKWEPVFRKDHAQTKR